MSEKLNKKADELLIKISDFHNKLGVKITNKEAVREVFFWQLNGDDNFSSIVLRLISKSDRANKMRLSLAFPELVKAYNEWQSSNDEDEFFKSYGLPGRVVNDG